MLALGRTASAGNRALADIKRGFVQLRLGELSGSRDRFDAAVRWFDQAALARPRWPYPWFGLALAKQALHGQDALVKSSRNQADGVSYFEGYTQAFGEVFARDSAFQPAVDRLRRVMLAQGERDQPKALLAPIRRLGLGSGGTADDALILARDYRRHDHGDSALIALHLFLERGGDSGTGSLEEARTLAALGSPRVAREAYLEGLRHLSAVTRPAYRADLAWIATSDEMLSFDRVADDSLGAWIGDFWQWRDVHELRAPGERLQEHLRRWAFV
ncbi:MAG TPA: hypothetical protein VLD58_02455, partial [Gemmatimonadales bacterium]|nr:hypothetical protein [Gemmatimonadales bacterium]